LKEEKKEMKKICLFLGFCLVFALASSAQAVVSLDASAANVTVPAERTEKIGAAKDGVILLNGNITWEAGQNYVAGNRLKASLNNSAKFVGTWAGLDAGGTTIAQQNLGAGNATILLQINTNGIVNGNTITLRRGAASTLQADVSSVISSPVTMTGVTLTSGLGTVDQPGTDTLIETLTQYSDSFQGAKTATIDAINNAAMLFSGGVTLAQGGTVKIDSTTAFGGPASICPTFIAGDQIALTLTDTTAAFNGLTNVIFNGAGGSITKTLGAATAQSFTFSAANLNALLAGTPGQNGTDMLFDIAVQAAGTVELQPRTIAVSNIDLGLTATGNGTTSLGSYGNVLVLAQNGTLYRANYARYDDNTTQNMFYKFSNSSGTAMKIEVRYHDKDATSAGTWSDYSANVPAYGVLTISKTGLDNVLGLGAGNYNGWVEFRIHGNESNITAICNAKYGDTWFNVPMSLNNGNPSWTH
jgi:hypothetical protein